MSVECLADVVFVNKNVDLASYVSNLLRYLMIGRTSSGRILVIIIVYYDYVEFFDNY